MKYIRWGLLFLLFFLLFLKLENRLSPWDMESSKNWLEYSSNGILTNLPSDSQFKSDYEEYNNETTDGSVLNNDDVDQFISNLNTALK